MFRKLLIGRARQTISKSLLAMTLISMTAIAKAQNPQAATTKISARLEAKATTDCIKAKFFLKNEGTEQIEIVYGRGGIGQDVVPEFHTRYLTITPSTVRLPGKRSMMDDILTIPPGEEVEYGTYILTNPFVSATGMVDTKEEYIQGYFVYREGKLIGRPKIDVKSNKIAWRDLTE